MRLLLSILFPAVCLALPSPNGQIPDEDYGSDPVIVPITPIDVPNGTRWDGWLQREVPVTISRESRRYVPNAPIMDELNGYGTSLHDQMRRALSERALQFSESQMVVGRIAKFDVTAVPVLRPATQKRSYWEWTSRYGIFRRRTSKLHVCDNFDSLVSAWASENRITPKIPLSSEASCRASDIAGRSYSIYPLGIVLHDDDDREEEIGHYVNFGTGTDTNRLSSFSGDLQYVTTWEEFKAAAHGVKLHAWKNGFDLGVQGEFSKYVATSPEYTLAPYASRLVIAYKESLGGTSDDFELFRSWCEDDGVWRMIL